MPGYFPYYTAANPRSISQTSRISRLVPDIHELDLQHSAES